MTILSSSLPQSIELPSGGVTKPCKGLEETMSRETPPCSYLHFSSPQTSKPLHCLVNEAVGLINHISHEKESVEQDREERRKSELLLDNMDCLLSTLRMYKNGELELDGDVSLKSDVESDFDEDECYEFLIDKENISQQ